MGSTPAPYQESFASASISRTPDAVADGLRVHPGLTWARRSHGLDACKTLTRTGEAWTSTPAPTPGGPEILRVAWHAPTPTLDALHAQLVASQAHPDTHAILAALRPELGERARDVRRCASTFCATSTSILCVDVDGAPLDPTLDVRGLVRAVLWALGLGEGAGVVWQWSASAGLKDGLRGRLWALWSRPVACEAVRRWLRHLRGEPTAGRPGAAPWADSAPYATSQPVYTAPPRIVGGADPYPVRLVLVDGPPVDPAPVEAYAAQEAMRARLEARQREAHAAAVRERAGLRGEGGGSSKRWLVEACARLASTPYGGRHRALVEVCGGAAEAVREGRLSLVEVEAALVEAVAGWGKPARHEATIRHELRRWAL
jgi:hypothetical protein